MIVSTAKERKIVCNRANISSSVVLSALKDFSHLVLVLWSLADGFHCQDFRYLQQRFMQSPHCNSGEWNCVRKSQSNVKLQHHHFPFVWNKQCMFANSEIILDKAIFHTSSCKAFFKNQSSLWLMNYFLGLLKSLALDLQLCLERIWIDVTNVKQGQLSDVSQSLLVHFCTLHFQGIMMHSHHT